MKGSPHWKSQRISAVALIAPGLLFLSSFVTSIGQPLPQVLAIWSGPAHALVAIAFLTIVFAHLQQGLHEVVTDYIHGPSRRPLMLTINTLCLILPLTAIAALVRIAFLQEP